MTGAAVVTLLVIIGVLVLMMANVASPDLLLLGGVVVLVGTGIVDPAGGFSGFANTGMLTVAALFVVAAGLRETGAVTLITSRVLGRPRSERRALGRLVPPVIFASSFLNNTTIVATLMPAVHDWARRIRVQPGRLLMPLSFASILGGTCTLIGTSTNLVVSGMLIDLAPTHPGLHELGMFEITPLGVCVALAGGALLVALAPALLPGRQPVLGTKDARQYVMELMVPPRSRLAGATIEAAGLRGLPGAFLMEVDRGDVVIPAVEPGQRLEEGDRLVFVGDIDAMVDLHRIPGLAAAPDELFKLEGQRNVRRIVTAVVAPGNPLIGLTVRDGGFRNRYQAVIIAVAHAAERVPGRIGDIVLTAGDVLLLETHPDFLTAHRRSNDFYVVSALEGATPPRSDRAPVALALVAALMILVTFELLAMVTAAFLAAGMMVLTRCCTVHEARRALDLTVLVAIAAAFGLGHAMQRSGLDLALAELVVSAGADSPFLALVAVYVMTAVLTELVTNNAAAVLGVPIALSLADRVGGAPMGYVIAVMMGASASFLTPIGYQTNLMVYSAGGYKPLDYAKLGLPLSVLVGTVTVLLIPWLWPL